MDKHLKWVLCLTDNRLCAPFVVDKDQDYYDHLKSIFNIIIDDAKKNHADAVSINIIDKYKKKILEAIRCAYKGEISKSHCIIKNLIKDAAHNPLAVSDLYNSSAFYGESEQEIQFFRARGTGDSNLDTPKDMLHLPFSKRSKTGSYRFSIPGVPSLYLGNTSYDCWLELERPSDYNFTVSPVIVDSTMKILNLAVNNRDFIRLNEFCADKVHYWLKLLILMIATSFRVKEQNRIFHSEYIISQSIMLACKELGLDGIAYYSKRVDNQSFAQSAINLALFAQYNHRQEYSNVCNRIKVGKPFNYAWFKQLGFENTNSDYDLRCLKTGLINNVGNYDAQFSYSGTEFCRLLEPGGNRHLGLI